MSQKTLDVRQKQKYDTSTNWATNNPVLLAGEIGIESDTNKSKIGDGSTSWNNLSYSDADVVHKTGDEDVGGTKTFLGQQRVKKASEGGGYFYVSPDGNGYNVKIGFSSGGQMMIHNGGFQIDRNLYPMNANSNLDLGTSSVLWHDLYLKGSLKDNNGNDIAIADIANKNNFGFPIIPTPSSTTLTDDEKNSIKAGGIVKGNINGLGQFQNYVFFPAGDLYSGYYMGFLVVTRNGYSRLYQYAINDSTNLLSFYGQKYIDIDSASNFTITGLNKADFGNNATITRDSSDRINLNYGNSAKVKVGSAETLFTNRIGADSDNSQDIGRSTVRWKDLYLAGNLTDATNSITVADIANKTALAPAYDSTATYAVGDVVVHGKKLYICSTAVEAAEAFDSTKWTEITVDSNYVDKTTAETITGEKTVTDTDISFKNSNASGNASWQIEEDLYGQLAVSRTYNNVKSKMMEFNGNSIKPVGNNGNLGSASQKWKDLYLSGNLTDGTNSISIAKIQDSDKALQKISDHENFAGVTGDQAYKCIGGATINGWFAIGGVQRECLYINLTAYSGTTYRFWGIFRNSSDNKYVNLQGTVSGVESGSSTNVTWTVSKTIDIDSEKQDKLTAGTNITIDANNVISATGGGIATDVKVDGTSITSNNEADIQTINGDYDASTNKFATENDLPDISGKQDATDNSLDTTDKTIVGAINEVDAIAKQANIAKSFASYSALITELNSEASTTYKVGQSFYIETLNVPDLWIISIESSSSSYTYVDDATFVTATAVSGGQQVGYYKLGQLETQKVDISTKMDKNNPTGTGSLAVGNNVTASGTNSVAVGDNTTASGNYSFAEGTYSYATGKGSHAEGSSDASGVYAHAEGNGSTASGNWTHAEGQATLASSRLNHVFGKYNVQDPTGNATTNGTYVEIVGNGTDFNTRSNARTLDWSGNEELAGNIDVKGGKIGDGKNANYKLAIPDTTSWTADKTIATTDQMPTELAELGDDSTHRLVTDTEKSTWNGKQDAITSTNKLDYSLLSNTPTIPDTSDFVHTTGNETIGGTKTFSSDVNIFDTGSSSDNGIKIKNSRAIDAYYNGTVHRMISDVHNTTLSKSGIFVGNHTSGVTDAVVLQSYTEPRPYYRSSSNYGSTLKEIALLSDVESKADLNNASQNIYANDITLQGYSMFNYCANLGATKEEVDSSSFANRSGWIRYKSGLQICWGYTALSGSNGNSNQDNNRIIFPVYFSTNPTVVATTNGSNLGSGYNNTLMIQDSSTTQVYVRKNFSENRTVYWIAIGKWN